MKNLKIIDLTLKNFKGLKDFSLKADGSDLFVEGGNATGKTTLFDSFTWLLFGKDSLNRSKFEIKTLDEDGEVAQHGLEHSVEGIFSIDDNKLKLRRVLMENWTKKRGESQKKFTGHTNKYYVNDEPVRKGKFDEVVSEIISEEAFRLLTNPLYFNEHLSVKERRETLIEIAGSVSDDEVSKGNEALEKFVDKLEGRTVEGYKKIINEKRKKLNKEIDKIPIRIDEINISLPDIAGLDGESLQNQYKHYEEEITGLHDGINDIRSGASVNEKRKELSDIDLKVSELKNAHGREVNENINKLQLGVQENEANIKLNQQTIDNEKQQIDSYKVQITRIDEYVESLRDQYRKEMATKIEYQADDICPTCSQDLPAEQVEEAKNKAEENFNVNKSKKLEDIQAEASNEKKRSDDLKELIDKSVRKIEKYKKEIESATSKVQKLNSELKQVKSNVTSIEDNEDYKKLMEKKLEVEKQITTIQDSNSKSVEAVQDQISQVKDKQRFVQEDLNKLNMAEKGKERLKELEEQEKNLNEKLEELDGLLFTAEEFERRKVDLLESKINKKFKFARFQLFEKQINGGYNDVCKTLYNGVPYDAGLNNASRINVGLDIINTLSSHYNFSAPIFIDNAESVVNLIEIEAQTISLVVKDKPSLEVKKNESKVA